LTFLEKGVKISKMAKIKKMQKSTFLIFRGVQKAKDVFHVQRGTSL